jgi:hypothetical protein
MCEIHVSHHHGNLFMSSNRGVPLYFKGNDHVGVETGPTKQKWMKPAYSEPSICVKYMFPITMATCLCPQTGGSHFNLKVIIMLVWKRAPRSKNEWCQLIQHPRHVWNTCFPSPWQLVYVLKPGGTTFNMWEIMRSHSSGKNIHTSKFLVTHKIWKINDPRLFSMLHIGEIHVSYQHGTWFMWKTYGVPLVESWNLTHFSWILIHLNTWWAID